MPSTESMYAQQSTLPRLPVPSLESSCALYLQSLKPLLSEEEFQASERHVTNFLTGPLGPSIQERLIDIDRASPYNWLEDNFWLRLAYLEWRDPLMINSNWYILGKDDDHHPAELLANDGRRPNGEFTHFQIQRAAHLIHRALEYNETIVKEALPVDRLKGKQPLCMWQYSRIFGVTRIPVLRRDTLVQSDPAKTHHIIVLVRDQIYPLYVYKQQANDWVRLSVDEIAYGLLSIVRHVLTLKNPQPNVPLMTSWNRDSWAAARNHLLTLHPANRETTHVIESSLFAVALDDYAHGSDTGLWSRTGLCGHQGRGNGRNRWFDKSVTLVVESSGKCLISGEHSPLDALAVSHVFDHMLDVPCPQSHHISVVQATATDAISSAKDTTSVQPLVWHVDDRVQAWINDAQAAADTTAAFSDSYVLHFDEYGTDWIKKNGRVPPDAFYQMAIQLTYYRHHKKVTATYETGSTRKFLRGRTDTIRTCSVDTKKLVEAWWDPETDSKTKYDLLAKAAFSHRYYTELASNGMAFDRHFLALKTLNADHQMISPVTGKLEQVEMHPMFLDPAYKESQTWRLSTSNLQSGVKLMGTGFGAPERDGYGINYMAAPNVVKISIECKQVPETLTAKGFADLLVFVLRDMRRVCEEVNQD